jgi:hypothetical protein
MKAKPVELHSQANVSTLSLVSALIRVATQFFSNEGVTSSLNRVEYTCGRYCDLQLSLETGSFTAQFDR